MTSENSANGPEPPIASGTAPTPAPVTVPSTSSPAAPTAEPPPLAVAQQALAADGPDLLLVTPGADLRYLTGYAALALERLTCLVLPASGEPVLVVPRLELPMAAECAAAAAGLRLRPWDETEDPFPLVADLARNALGREPASVGLADRMWAAHVLRFLEVLPDARAGLRSASVVTGPLRLRKRPDEVEALRRAADAIDAVHLQMAKWLHPGRTEAEVGRDISAAILESGHATVNFVIVAAGPNGASPHHAVSSRIIQRGEPVVVDIGGTMPDGYCSDCTRTYCVGPPPADFAAYYEVLRTAQKAACAAVRPGTIASSVDAAARDVITASGYGEFFVHRTGHGIGLQEHEEPWIVAGNETPLASGMAFSVEPGIYLPGRHGARIEDIVVVAEDGCDRLDRLPRELAVL